MGREREEMGMKETRENEGRVAKRSSIGGRMKLLFAVFEIVHHM